MSACPTCDDPDVRDRHCWTCGTPAGGPVSYPDLPTYRLLRWGVAAVVGVACVVLVDAATGLFPLLGRSMAWADAERYEWALAVAYLLAYLAAGVPFIVWTVRARRNLEAFPGAAAGWSPGWAVAGWLIPFANLVIPFLVMAGIARESLYRVRTAPWIAVWWIGYAAAGLFSNLGGALADERDSGYDAAWHAAAYDGSAVPGNILSTLLLAVSGVAISVLIVRVGRAQEDRLDRAARLAAAPTPAGTVAAGTGAAGTELAATGPADPGHGDATIGR